METLGTHTTRQINGTPLHWAELGQGRPLVMLHGLWDSMWTWRRVAPWLARTHRVLLLDLPGHGLSGRPDASYDLDWHAGLATAWMDHLGLDEVDLVGHSFGGGVAQCLLRADHRRVRRLGLVASGGLGREVSLGLRLLSLPGAEQVVQPFIGPGTRLGMRQLGEVFSAADRRRQGWLVSRPYTARALVRTARGVIGLGGQRRHFLDHAHELPHLPPLAVYWGEGDRILPPDHARRMQTRVREVQVTLFPQCGHFPHLERPEQFHSALSGFLHDATVRQAVVLTLPARRPPKRWWFGRMVGRAVGWLGRLWMRLWRPAKRPKRALLPAVPASDG